MKKFSVFNLAQEAIAFQKDTFFRELSALLDPYVQQKSKLSGGEKSVLGRGINACIKKFTGADLDIIFSHDGAYIQLPIITANHPLMTMWQDYFDESTVDGLKVIRRAKSEAKGVVDLKNARLTGIFTKFNATLNMDLGMIESSGYYTAEEVAAVTLHEVGHFFTVCEMVSHVVTTNLILSGLDKALRGADPKTKEIALEEAGRALEVEKSVIDNLKETSDAKTVVTVLAAATCTGMRSEYGDKLYDWNACEMMADQFASRLGAGRELMSALDKLYKQYGVSFRKGKLSYLLSALGEILTVLLGGAVWGGWLFAASASAGAALVGFIVVSIAIALIFAAGGGVSMGQALYETPQVRVERVRRQLIEYSKAPSHTAETIKKIVDHCKYLEELAKSYEQNESIWGPIGRFLFSSVRTSAKSIELQRNLEALALNDLFLKGAELRRT